jgi:transposase
MMANVLNVALVESIQSLHAQGWSRRRIARELGVDRETVGKYVSARSCGQNPPNLPTGSVSPKPATVAGLPASEPADRQIGNRAGIEDPKPATNLPTGSGKAGPASKCEPLRDVIAAKMAEGLTARRIHQDLGGAASGVGYDSVRRFIQRLGRTRPLPFRRMECAPGEEAQVDFGSGAAVVTPEGKRRRTHVFRIVLSHSRKAYSEATFTQTTEDFFRCLENAFAHFGGVPRTLVIDNLKAAVAHPDWFDPELTPKVQSFCRHYGTVILPTKPYMPRHKGKVESGVKYVKNNALKGHTFNSLEDQNRHLADWERTVADTRIHGTTKRQVGKVFADVERAALAPLPTERFACFHEARRKVNRDGHIEVARAYYSVPPEYLTREVWVRWDARLVRVFNHRWEQIAVHVRHEQGRFSTHGQHLVKEKISGLERGANYLLDKVGLIGPQTQAWAEAMLSARGIEGTRVLQGLLALTKKHASASLEKACETALAHDCFRLRSIRQLLQRQTAKQEPLPFLDEHPLIRPLDDYAAIVARALHRQADRPSVGEGLPRHDWTKAKSLAALSPAPSGNTADLLPPRSGYPLPGCSSAEPGSVSPDQPTIVPPSSPDQEHPDE